MMKSTLLWELLAWALPQDQQVSTLIAALAKSKGPLAHPCEQIASAYRIRAGIDALRNVAGTLVSHGRDTERLAADIRSVVNPYKRNSLRKDLLRDATQMSKPPLSRQRPYERPTVWSVRFVPVDFTSPVVRSRQSRLKNAGEDDEEIADRVSSRRVLALAFNLRTGGFICEVLGYRAHYDPRAREVELGHLSLRQVGTFLGRFAPALHAYGGYIALPRRLGDGPHLNDELRRLALGVSIPIAESLPCLWPGEDFIEIHVADMAHYQSVDGYWFRFAEGLPTMRRSPDDDANFLTPPQRVLGGGRRLGRPRKPRAE